MLVNKHIFRVRQTCLLAVAFWLVGCQSVPSTSPETKSSKPSPVQSASLPEKPISMPSQPYALLKRASWVEQPGLAQENWQDSWRAWLQSCRGLKNKPDWSTVCAAALTVAPNDHVAIQSYWQEYFDVYQAHQSEGAEKGLITGYYQPVLKGSRNPTASYSVPLYKTPPDLVTVSLSGLFPELKYKRVRGRLQGQSLIPYYTRAEIEQNNSPLVGNELIWVSDAVEAFFLQVQGSGIVELNNGEQISVGYADQNGHPYQSIGKLLVERGEMGASEASMQGIKAWAQQHPDQLRALLDANPSYVFFKLLPSGLSGPLGALGVPLTAARSIAIDPFYIPLGAPVYLATTYPNSEVPLQQLMQAQDTGGAIKGGVRADVYWGAGESAGKLAGGMRQQGQLWVWLPKKFPVPH